MSLTNKQLKVLSKRLRAKKNMESLAIRIHSHLNQNNPTGYVSRQLLIECMATLTAITEKRR